MNLQFRKYTLALLSLVSAIVGLFCSKIDQGGFVTIVTLILSIYGASNIADKKIAGGQG